MDAHPASIRTPDQRIRVFLSSTLRELEPEREAARAAIESLRLAPVMFELGARPHPPRSLYRAYLAQSDIFVGVYWESYGWVAPDEHISGLEDEYRLSGSMPHLIYIKHPAPKRDPRLDDLLNRIRSDDHSSYRGFQTPAELADLIVADVATLLADRFDASRAPAPVPPGSALAIPAPFTSIVGRGTEHDRLIEMLGSPGVRLVTIVGPGGIGKSRLAIEVAETIAQTGREVAFAMLESVATPERVVSMIARAVGVRDTGDEPLEAKLLTALAGRDLLLVVDNMEHVIDATADLVHLITALPRLQLLVTSRSPLRVRAERTFELGPLAVPDADASMTDAAATSAVALFVDRAMAINPAFQLSDESAGAIGGIVRALDGVPLAIELAAARTRTMSPHEILERLDSALSLLVGGARDLPERQRTVRSTIEWSARLLNADATAAFQALSAFAGPFTIDAAEAVLAASDIDAFSCLEALVDASLLRQRERDSVRVFDMLVLVRAFAREAADAETSALARERWVAYYVGLASQAPMRMRASDQLSWMRRLDAEAENLAAVMRHLLDASRLDEAAEYAWSLYLYLWIDGLLGTVRTWMTELLARAERDGIPLAPRTEAIALYFTRAIAYWQDPGVDVLPGLQSSAALFDEAGDAASGALARVSVALAYPVGADRPRSAGCPRGTGAGPRRVLGRRRLVGAGDDARHSRADRPGHARRAGRRGAVRGELPAGLLGGRDARNRDRAAPSRLAQALLGRPRRRRGGLRRVARHVGRDAPRRGHRLRTRRARGGACRAGRRRAGRLAGRGGADPASAHGVAEPGEPQPVRPARGRPARERCVGGAGCRDRGGRRAAGRGGGGACHPLKPLGAAS